MTRAPVSTRAGWLLVLLAASASVVLAVAWALRPPVALAAVVGLGTVAAAAGLRAMSSSRRAGIALLFGVVCSAGLCRGALAPQAGAAVLGVVHSGPAVLVGTVREGNGSRRRAAQVVIDVDRVVQGDIDRRVHAGVLATLRSGPPVLPGDRVELDVAGLLPPTSLHGGAILVREGIDAVAQSSSLTVQAHGGPSPQRFLAIVRAKLATAVDAALPEPAASLVDGIVFGISRPLSTDLTAALRDSGLAHILAISGLKVVLVAAMVTALCTTLSLAPRARLLLIAGSVGSYVLLCGATPAAVRSAVMAGAGWALHGTGRAPDPLPLLSCVGGAMLFVDPGLCADVGFQLTFLGTLGIVLFASPLSHRLPGPSLVREPFAMTLSAQVVTLPVMASTFGVISLVGPFANAIAVPLLPPLIATGLMSGVVSMVVPALGVIGVQVAGLLALLVSAIARVASALPGAAIHVTAWPRVFVIAELCAVASAIGVLMVFPRLHGDGDLGRRPLQPTSGATTSLVSPRATISRPPLHRLPRRAVAAAACLTACLAGGTALVAASRPDGRLHISVLDVGAATAVAVQTRDGSDALVDTGADPQRLLQALGPVLPPLRRTIDLLVLTGGDRASVGGLPALADRYEVARAIAPAGALHRAGQTALSALQRRGTAVDLVPPDGSWAWGGAAWRLLSADGTADADALSVTDPTGSVLVLGAVAVDAQEELAATHGDAVAADLLVTPPSGGVAPALLAAMRPRSIAIPSAASTRSPTTSLITGPGVRITAESGTLSYSGSEGGLIAS